MRVDGLRHGLVVVGGHHREGALPLDEDVLHHDDGVGWVALALRRCHDGALVPRHRGIILRRLFLLMCEMSTPASAPVNAPWDLVVVVVVVDDPALAPLSVDDLGQTWSVNGNENEVVVLVVV